MFRIARQAVKIRAEVTGETFQFVEGVGLLKRLGVEFQCRMG